MQAVPLEKGAIGQWVCACFSNLGMKDLSLGISGTRILYSRFASKSSTQQPLQLKAKLRLKYEFHGLRVHPSP